MAAKPPQSAEKVIPLKLYLAGTSPALWAVTTTFLWLSRQQNQMWGLQHVHSLYLTACCVWKTRNAPKKRKKQAETDAADLLTGLLHSLKRL